MERKNLEALGLDKEQINTIMAEYGKSINTYKEQVDSLTAEKNTLQNQVNQSASELDSLKEQITDNKNAQKQINDLQEQLKNVQSKAQEELLKVKKNNAINNALKDAHVIDNKAILPFLKVEEIHYSDNGLTGLKDQLTELKNSKAFLFETEKPEEPQGIKATAGKITKVEDGQEPAVDVAKASYQELAALKAKDPEKFKQIIQKYF